MTELLQLPSPLEGDISLRMLGRLAGWLDNVDLSVPVVFLADTVDSSVLSWLDEQFSLSGDGWELAESDDVRHMLTKAATELHRYKGTPWSIREVIRRLGFGEVDLIEGIGRLSCDDNRSYNELFAHGDVAVWAVYCAILKQSTTNDQVAILRQTLAVFAPARYYPASLEYQSVVIRYNDTAIHDGSYNYGSD